MLHLKLPPLAYSSDARPAQAEQRGPSTHRKAAIKVLSPLTPRTRRTPHRREASGTCTLATAVARAPAQGPSGRG